MKRGSNGLCIDPICRAKVDEPHKSVCRLSRPGRTVRADLPMDLRDIILYIRYGESDPWRLSFALELADLVEKYWPSSHPATRLY